MRTRTWDAADLTTDRWDATAAGRVVAAWRGSGMSLAGFARANGVKVQRLSWWRKRLDGESVGERPRRAARARVAFIPAVLSGVARVTVRLPGGVEIEARDVAALSPAWIAALAREIVEPS